jgi:protein-tyrosine phosphatase
MSSLLTAILTSRPAMAVKRPLKNVYWRYRGRRLQNPEPPASARSILFVCKGNICRSPYAERYTSGLLGNDVRIESAGIKVNQGNRPPDHAVAVASERGLSLAGLRPRELTKEMMNDFDMVVVMEGGQLEQLAERFEEHRGKLFLLPLYGEHRGGYLRYNLPDPYGKGIDIFRECYDAIESCLRGLLDSTGLTSRPI